MLKRSQYQLLAQENYSKVSGFILEPGDIEKGRNLQVGVSIRSGRSKMQNLCQKISLCLSHDKLQVPQPYKPPLQKKHTIQLWATEAELSLTLMSPDDPDHWCFEGQEISLHLVQGGGS